VMGNLRKHVQEDMSATLVASGVLEGRPVYCVKLAPKGSGAGDERVLCWIDTERFVLLKSEVWKGSSKALAITFAHRRADKGFLMPTEIVCEISRWVLGESQEPARISVTFSNYRINVGLEDSIFEGDQN